MRLGIFQGPLSPGDTLGVLRDVAARAAGELDLVVFPELFLTGYNIGADRLRALAEPADGASAAEAARIARSYNVALLYGYPECCDDGRIYNSALLIGRDGVRLANFRKLHLFGKMENAVFTPGDDALVMAEIDGIKLGILICYDVEFPEAVRNLALRGADLIAVPTALMRPFEFVPRVLIAARAYENSVCVAYANHCGSEGELDYPGESCIIGPEGQMLARADEGEELITADIDAGMFVKARVFNTYLADRRPALYTALTQRAK